MRRILALSFTFCLTCAAALAQTSAPRPPARGIDPLAPPQGQTEDERLNAEVSELYRAGKFKEAVPVARRVLELREKSPGGDQLPVLRALYNLAAIYVELKKDGEAEPLLKRALAAGEKLGQPARLLVAEISSQLAMISYRGRDYSETETHLLRARDIIVETHGAGHPSVVPVLLNLAELEFQRRRPAEAETHLGQAVDVLLKQPPRKDPEAWERMKRYACLLTEESREGELSKRLGKVLYRFEEPEKAAAAERRERERKERGEDGPAVQGGVLNGRVIERVRPAYPVEATQRGISGKVIVRILVDEEGKVSKAEPFCGNPILSEAAVVAVRGWRFTPTLLDGVPAKVTGTVTVNFALRR